MPSNIRSCRQKLYGTGFARFSDDQREHHVIGVQFARRFEFFVVCHFTPLRRWKV